MQYTQQERGKKDDAIQTADHDSPKQLKHYTQHGQTQQQYTQYTHNRAGPVPHTLASEFKLYNQPLCVDHMYDHAYVHMYLRIPHFPKTCMVDPEKKVTYLCVVVRLL